MSTNSLNDILYGYIKNNQRELLEEALRATPTPMDFILIKSAILIKNFQVIPTLFTHYCANFTLRPEQVDSLLDYCAIAGDIRAIDYFLTHKDLSLDIVKCTNTISMTASMNGHFEILDYLYNLNPQLIDYMENTLGESFLVSAGVQDWVNNIKEVLEVRRELDIAIPLSEAKNSIPSLSLVDDHINKI